MAATESYRLKNPPHPGGFIRTEIIQSLGVSITVAARALGVTRPALSSLLNERSALSRRDGSAYRKGFRSPHGYTDADAEQLRYLPGATAGE